MNLMRREFPRHSYKIQIHQSMFGFTQNGSLTSTDTENARIIPKCPYYVGVVCR